LGISISPLADEKVIRSLWANQHL